MVDTTNSYSIPSTQSKNTNISVDVPPMTEEEIKEALNIPERNKEDYPDIPKDVQVKAGTFLYKLNLLASGADGNLQSLVWNFYDKLDDFIHLDKDGSSLKLAQSIEDLRDYIQEHDNIIFHDIEYDKAQENKQ